LNISRELASKLAEKAIKAGYLPVEEMQLTPLTDEELNAIYPVSVAISIKHGNFLELIQRQSSLVTWQSD
jgi:hypothetical protein